MISVIVPVYNVGRYLERCVESILAQTRGDYEVLLIDDGSTDGSGALCDELALKDGRIRAFHKANGGLADARNYGLERAGGEYVTFIDSDDYVGPDYLKILVELMEDAGADMSVVALAETHSEGLTCVDSRDERFVWDRGEAYREMVLGRKTGVSACAKLFKGELFDGVRFPVGRFYEDLHTAPYLFEKCGRVAYSTSRQYYYFQRGDSIMHSISDKKIEDWSLGIENLYQFTETRFPQSLDGVICRYINFGFASVINNLVGSDDYVRRARQFQRRHSDWWRRALTNPYLTKKERALTLLFMLSPGLYGFAYKKYHQRKGA